MNNPQMGPRTPCVLTLKILLSREDTLFLGFRSSDSINPTDQTWEISNVAKFLTHMIPKAQATKGKADKLGFIKIKHFCKSGRHYQE